MSWLLVGLAWGQQTPIVPRVNSQLYRPPIDARTTLWTESAGTIVDGMTPAPRVALHYVHRPLIFLPEGDEAPTVLVGDVLQVDAIFSTAIDRFRFAVDVPVYLYSTGELTDNGPGIGDLALDVRGIVVDPEEAAVGLSVSARTGLPTATVDTPLGDSGISGELMANGELRPLDALTLVANLGHRFNPTTALQNAELGDQFVWRTGAGYTLADTRDAGVSLDLAGRTAYSAAGNRAGNPIEALVGGWGRVTDDWVLRVGVGRGLTPGVGSPQLRVVTALTLDPPTARDRDSDGIVDAEDQCTTEAEDLDGFEDNDGCPDPSIAVAVTLVGADGAPVEGRWSVVGQGTPQQGARSIELHPGSYTIEASAEDYEPGEVTVEVPAEASVEIALTLVTPTSPLQLIVVDAAGVAVDAATWSIDDGPSGTSDSDGYAEVPLEPGAYSVVVSAPGYRTARVALRINADKALATRVELQPSRVEVTRERIEISETVSFETGMAVVRDDSHDLLDEVSEILVDHPEILRVRVEGHTDSRGGAATNQALSKSRAAAVLTYLVDHGVEAERLMSEGYGETVPIDRRNVAEAWDVNRRVQFTIVELSEPE